MKLYAFHFIALLWATSCKASKEIDLYLLFPPFLNTICTKNCFTFSLLIISAANIHFYHHMMYIYYSTIGTTTNVSQIQPHPYLLPTQTKHLQHTDPRKNRSRMIRLLLPHSRPFVPLTHAPCTQLMPLLIPSLTLRFGINQLYNAKC